MDFNQFPQIYQILQEENLVPEITLSNGNLLCLDGKGRRFVMKDLVEKEGYVYNNIFPKIEGQVLEFSSLIIPKLYKIVDKYIFLEYYDGKNFNENWNEFSANGFGGRGIPVELVDILIDLLFDFSKIDISLLPVKDLIEFDLNTWKSVHFPSMLRRLEEFGLVSEEQKTKANKLFEDQNLFLDSKKVLTNGDFYHRNFILMPDNKIVVIDWEGRTDDSFNQNIPGYRNAMINYLENHIAFLYVHMWGNPGFQREFLKKSISNFQLSIKNIQAAILIKSLEQTCLWLHNYDEASYLAIDQAQIFINMIDIANLESIIK